MNNGKLVNKSHGYTNGIAAAAAPAASSSCHDWDSPAYERLLKHGLLRTDWRKSNIDELEFKPGNATPGANVLRRLACIAFPPASCFLKTVEVPAGTVVKMQNGRGGFAFLGNRGSKQGVHAYWDLFYRVSSTKEVRQPDPNRSRSIMPRS